MAQLGGEIFLSDYQFVGFKLETDRGVPVTLATGDYNMLASDVKVETDIKENQRKYAVGDGDAFTSVMAGKAAKITMKIPVKGSGSGSTAPVFFTACLAAGFQASSTSGNFVLLKKIPSQTATMEFVLKEDTASSPRGKKWTVKGCGAEKFTMHFDNTGGLMLIEATFYGAIVSIGDIANGLLPVPSITTETTVPPAALSITSTYRGVNLPISAFTIDCGNTGTLIEMPTESSGYGYYAITGHDPIVNISPRIQSEATQAFMADLLAVPTAEGELDLFIGSGTNQVQIVAPKAQVVKGGNVGSQNGIAADTIMLRITRNQGVATNPLFAIFCPKS